MKGLLEACRVDGNEARICELFRLQGIALTDGPRERKHLSGESRLVPDEVVAPPLQLFFIEHLVPLAAPGEDTTLLEFRFVSALAAEKGVVVDRLALVRSLGNALLDGDKATTDALLARLSLDSDNSDWRAQVLYWTDDPLLHMAFADRFAPKRSGVVPIISEFF